MIIRRDFEAGHYHVAADAPFQDASLSWQARGVMGYLFTKPPDWTPRMYDIVNAGPCKKHKIKSIFKELEAAGYLHRRKIRTEGGTFDWEVVLFDHPRSDPPWSESTPEAVHPGANGGANHNDVQSDSSLTIKTERERAPAREERTKPTLEDVKAYANMQAIPEQLAEKFFYHYESEGWETRHGKVMRWQPRLQKWKVEQHKYTTTGSTPAARGTMKQL